MILPACLDPAAAALLLAVRPACGPQRPCRSPRLRLVIPHPTPRTRAQQWAALTTMATNTGTTRSGAAANLVQRPASLAFATRLAKPSGPGHGWQARKRNKQGQAGQSQRPGLVIKRSCGCGRPADDPLLLEDGGANTRDMVITVREMGVGLGQVMVGPPSPQGAGAPWGLHHRGDSG